MTKEKYEKPIMEVVDLKDDVILTSGATPGCTSDCWTDGVGCVIDRCDFDLVDQNISCRIYC